MWNEPKTQRTPSLWEKSTVYKMGHEQWNMPMCRTPYIQYGLFGTPNSCFVRYMDKQKKREGVGREVKKKTQNYREILDRRFRELIYKLTGRI